MQHSLLFSIWLSLLATGITVAEESLRPVPLTARVTNVQPMTGIVLWETNEKVQTAPIQLEYAYLKYDQIVERKGVYDWKVVDELLDRIASRKHQAILRWHDTYVAQPTGVPAYIKSLADYRETAGRSEGKKTSFPDWSHPELQSFTLDFFTEFAKHYDRDPRLAFVQVGFGLWAEYHIYDGPMKLETTFPSLEYQSTFLGHLNQTFRHTPWMISVDAAGDHTPLASNNALLDLGFGVFDDSFNHKRHKIENEPNWNTLRRDRWKIAPAGGEFSFFERKDQKEALAPSGPHSIPFETHAAAFQITFMIGDDQPRFQKPERIRDAGLACGYRFEVTRFDTSASRSQITIRNNGIAPIYHDAFPAIDGVRASESLKGLLPGASREFDITAGGSDPKLSIESDRLVPGQRIEFDANLP